jgi:vancomycin resistance protein YoaR
MPERQTSSGTVGSDAEVDGATGDGSVAAALEDGDAAPTERSADARRHPAAPSPSADLPTDDVPTVDVPTDDAPTVDVPTDDVPTADVPTDDVPTADVPTDDVPTAPARTAPDEPAPAEVPDAAVPTPPVPAPADAEPTEVIPRSAAAEAAGAVPAAEAAVTDVIAHEALVPPPVGEAPTTVAPSGGDEPPTELIPAVAPPPRPRRRRRALLLTGLGVVGLLVLLYAVDLVSSSGTVPRGVTVAGQEIGGLSHAEAEQRVRAAVEPRTTQPVAVAVGDVTSEIDPKTAGLTVDWPGTIDRAGSQPRNPITRLRSFFTTREVGVATVVGDDALDSALQQLAPLVNKPPAEGTVRFEGVTPVPVPPVDGQELDLAGARQTLAREWTSGERVSLPTTVLPPVTTQDDVTKALTEVATPAVAGSVTVTGEDVTGTISPEVIASALSFRADRAQGLVPELNRETVEKALDPQLASSEQPGRDATLSFVGGRPVVTPSQDGRGVDYEATLKDLLAVLTKTGDERTITAVYAAQPAKLTTEELNGLGIVGVISEFTTGGFAQDSGRNIKRAAEVINGMIVKPGETFSLNGATEPRDEAHGYVEAGIISEGHASRGVGGGVSQVATTLYNAAYFAGMTDVTHKPHSFYIGRYPPGREATVFEGSIDMKFRNDLPTGVMIQTAWTPSSLTIRMYGTKRYDVTSSTGPRTNPTEPTKVEIPSGKPCVPSQGAPGFTVTDTRTLRDVKTGQVKSEKRTTKYNPSPIVTCGSE